MEPFDVQGSSIADTSAALAARAVSVPELTGEFLARIERLHRGPVDLRSVLEVNPDAMAAATALQDELGRTGARGSLHGIPVLIKDNIDTADSMLTTAGSLALAGSRPARDAVVVRRLRDAGAVVIGKTNLSEWANFRSRGRPVVGVRAVDRPGIPMCWIGPPAAAVPVRRWRLPPAWRSQPWGPRRMARSSVRHPSAAWSASSRRWAWSTNQQSSRSLTARTPSAFTRAPSPMPPPCCK